jgi:hypothetical protein
MIEIIIILYVLFVCIALLEEEPKPKKFWDPRDADRIISLIRVEPSDEMLTLRVIKNRNSKPYTFYAKFSFDNFDEYIANSELKCPICEELKRGKTGANYI